MHYVLLATHSPDICPTSNARTRELVQKRSSEMPDLARKHGIRIIAGPLVSREHLSVVVLEAAAAERVDRFIAESGLAQWNSVRVVPSITMEEGMKELTESKPVF
jgi:hypothetical protein